jgi:hypothetical protein
LHWGTEEIMRLRILALISPLILLSVYGASFAYTDDLKSTIQSQDHKRSECRDVTLTRKPGWTLSGGFTPDGSRLLLVDALSQTILRYSDSGESLGTIGEPVKSTLRDLLPVTGKFRGSEFILEVSDGLMLLDKNLRPVTTKSVASKREEWSIGGLWEWEPVGKDVVAFADIVHGKDQRNLDNWRTAFVRFPLDDPGQLQVLQSFDLTGTPNKGYFRTGYPYITALGETAYFLSLNKGLALYKHEKGKGLENVSDLLPKGLSRPALPDWDTMDQYVGMMKNIETASMPVGLYGWHDSLYLLYRSPQNPGTRWQMYSIDPSRKNPTRRVDLPIRANHVTVIPGTQKWAFVEKGPVLSFGAQDISRMLLIPSVQLEAPLRATGMLCSR